jgi:hypothetical protein
MLFGPASDIAHEFVNDFYMRKVNGCPRRLVGASNKGLQLRFALQALLHGAGLRFAGKRPS